MTKYQESLFKENIDAMYLSLAERVVGHKISLVADVNYINHRSEEPPPHFLKIVRTPGSKKLTLLQMQIVDEDNMEMQYNMFVYFAQLLGKYEFNPLQVVLYLGEGISQMPDSLRDRQNFFCYELCSIQAFSYKTFLESKNREELMLTILADLENEQPETVIEKMLQKAKKFKNTFFSFDRFSAQLEKFASLRKYNEAYNNVIDQLMLLDTKIQDSYIFKKGAETAKKEMIAALIQKGQMSSEEIAEVAGVSSDFVKEVAYEIENGKD